MGIGEMEQVLVEAEIKQGIGEVAVGQVVVLAEVKHVVVEMTVLRIEVADMLEQTRKFYMKAVENQVVDLHVFCNSFQPYHNFLHIFHSYNFHRFAPQKNLSYV